MKKKHIIAILAAVLVATPLFAVFTEKDLAQTLSVLRYELNQDYAKLGSRQGRLEMRSASQHSSITEMVKKCNELSLILYSQNPDFTFDMTYALNEVTEEYDAFKKRKMPYDEMLARYDLEIEKYENLIRSLKRIPPRIKDERDTLSRISFMSDSVKAVTDSLRAEMISSGDTSVRFGMAGMPVPRMQNPQQKSAGQQGMQRPDPEKLKALRDTSRQGTLFWLDEQGQQDRDSCIIYATALLNVYKAAKISILVDSEYYESASKRLEESYTYAQNRYRDIQKKIFIQGQDDYFTVLGSFGSYARKAIQDAKAKYNTAFDIDNESIVSHSQWRGPKVLGFIALVLVYIMVATLLSIIIINILKKRVKKFQDEEFRKKMPCLTLLCGFVIFAFSLPIASHTLNQNFFRMASRLLLIFAWLVSAILLSIFIRLRGDKIRYGLRLYTPLILLGLIIITFRIIFIPNSLVNLILPPLLVLFFFWQLSLCLKAKGKVENSDVVYAWITLVVIAATAIMAISGYVLLAVQAVIWWLFQFAAIETITALYDILSMYYEKFIAERLAERRKKLRSDFSNKAKGTYIEITWLFDLIEMVAVPVLAIASIPFCIWLATGVFDLSETCKTIFYKPFFNLTDASGNDILHLSIYKLVLTASLFFIFRYAAYAIKAFYRHLKFQSTRRKSGQDYIRANQINLTLANNVISILVWGTYIVIAIILLKIPMGAISIVAAGLATGIGLALKDILNNFIYGIQLMSGRLRVGDYVECDGIRGKVESITYQSTQIETIDGAVMAFTNTTLFNKNFKNLTRNNSYEFVKILVGVSYGTSVDEARKVILEALEPVRTKDRFNREIVDPARGISVAFSDFADSAVELAIKQYVLVEEEIGYIARAKEAVYAALGKAGIEIPFPQRDVSVRIEKD